MNRLLQLVLLVAVLSLVSAQKKSPKEWQARTIYQVLTDRFDKTSTSGSACSNLSQYCGGTWKGIENRLDYIKDAGFDAIWISPMVENTPGGYHGYWLKNLFTVNSYFGTAQDLKSLISTAHSKGIWVMLDVVGNHVGDVDMAFDQITPFNSSSHYHSKCQITDWNNQAQVETCRLANLPDLDQSNSFVRQTLLDWASTLADDYGFDGLRIDTVPEVEPNFWKDFNQAAGMYCVGEAFNGNIAYVSNYQHYLDGMLNYPLYYTLRNVFVSQQSMTQMSTLLGPSGTLYSYFPDPASLGNFVDNHDNSRFLFSQSSWTLYKNALAAMLFNVGIPIIYYGTEQGYHGGNDPANRESLWPNFNTNSELYTFLQTLINARKKYTVWTQPQVQRYSADHFYAFSRGPVLVCLTNSNGQGSDVSVKLTYLPWTEGQTACNVADSSDCITVSSGAVTVTLQKGLPKVYAPKV